MQDLVCANEKRRRNKMITTFTLQQLAANYGGEVCNGSNQLNSVSIDSRKVVNGDLFVALKGDRFDAHDYLQQALDQGVTAFVINKNAKDKIPEIDGMDIWLVDDTTVALGNIAEWQRDHFDKPLIAVTGSSGKTTVKGMLSKIFAVYVGEDAIFATKGNFNNHIGVPLSLMSIEKKHQYAVIEMGASGPQEIAYLTGMAKPTIALVNNVMPAHVEGFGSVDAIANAKGEIYQGLNETGTAIVNGDDVYAGQWLEQVKKLKTLVFSMTDNLLINGKQAQIRARNINLLKNGCYSFCLVCEDQAVVVKLAVLGKHNITNAIAAAACAYSAGMDIEFIRMGLEKFRGEAGRVQVVEGCKGSTLIDDTYNANPGSVKAAIDILAEMPGRTVLVLGDMGELGDEAEFQHQVVGQYAAEKNIAHMFTLGKNSAFAATAFGSSAQHCSTFETLIEGLTELVADDVAILVKGSRSSRMERVINALKSSGDNNNASLAC